MPTSLSSRLLLLRARLLRASVPTLLFALACAASTASAGSTVMPYTAFGPQEMSYETLGFEWWQWDSHGDSRPREYDIHVVVYCNTSAEEVARAYPVNQAAEKDYRYIKYPQALEYLDKNIAEDLDSSLTEQLKATRQKIVEQLPACH